VAVVIGCGVACCGIIWPWGANELKEGLFVDSADDIFKPFKRSTTGDDPPACC
jgi:hypothetical protein